MFAIVRSRLHPQRSDWSNFEFQARDFPKSSQRARIAVRHSLPLLHYILLVKVNGTRYQTPCALVVGKDETDELEFGKVDNIYIYENSAVFEFIPMLTHQFYHHHHAFVLATPPISV